MNPEEEKTANDIIKKLVSKEISLTLMYNVESILLINNLRSLIKIDCSDLQILDALFKIKKESKSKISDLIIAIKSKMDADEKADKSTLWNLVIPFDAPVGRKRVTINGCEFRICNYISLKKYKSREYSISVREKLHPIEIIKHSQKYLMLSSSGATIHTAWKKVEPQFKILKGVYDFSVSYNSWTFLTSNRNARSNIQHPQYIYGLSNSNLAIYIEFIVNDCHSKIDPLKKKEILIFNQLVKFLKDNPSANSIELFLSDLFRLYSEAMDENLFSNSYLRFWQVLEKLSLSETRGSSTEFKNRIHFFLHEAYPIDLANYFDLLIKKRNELVHRGIDNIEIADISLLKNLCEKIILWVYNNRKIIKTTKHLESYYYAINRSALDLSISSKMMLKILDHRKKINNGL
jgi:uncharacterized protein YeeX (DUF496 family)